MPTLRRFPQVLVCLCLAGVLPAGAAERPNLVVVLADDQGWGDLSVNGNTNLSTPALDALARAGARFEHFYVSPVCSPTRAEFLTGRQHPRGGVHDTSRGGERLDLDETTIAEVFRRAGYATGAFGKWHNGSQAPYHPNARGFQEYHGFTSGHWGEYFDPPLEHDGQPVRGRGYIADDFTDHALSFIEAHRGGPFFCYLAFNTPHSPWQVPDRDFAQLEGKLLPMRYPGPQPEEIETTRAVLAMNVNLDRNVGRLLSRLDALGLARDTIVVYFSDNGPATWRWNGGMRGKKGSTDEGGVRSPLFVRWPGRIAPGTVVRPIAAAIDLLPTLAELCGVPLAGTRPLDGLSLAALLLGKTDKAADRTLFSHWNGQVGARSQRFRLDAAGRLYDIEADPGQTRDVAAEHPDEARRLRGEVARWRREVLSEMGPDERPFTLGEPGFPLTVLPARDGLPRGEVRRSARAPNCSFFTNWRTTADRITWDVEVRAPGRFEVELNYTCPATDVGSKVELELKGQRISATIAEGSDPPLRGAERDRAPRGPESYVKDFRPLRLGVIDLPRGRGELSLRALEVPGGQVADVRSISFRRLD